MLTRAGALKGRFASKSAHTASGLLLLAGLTLLIACTSATPAGSARQAVAPFTLTLFSGQSLQSSTLSGKVVFVNFWASWCVPCKEEAPDLARTWQDYSPRGVQFVGVNMKDDPHDAALSFLQEVKFPYASGQDVDGAMALDFKVSGLPNSFVLDKRGSIMHRFVGKVTRERLGQLLDQALAE